MPNGIQVFNADGSLQFDMTSRLFRTLGEISIPANTAGSQAVAGLTAAGTPAVLVELGTDSDNADAPPAVTRSGDTISWTAGRASKIKVLVY